MRSICIASCLLTFIMVSCNDEGTASGKTELVSPKNASDTNCYRYAAGGDTVSLQVIRAGDSATGFLAYNFKEKDDNVGTFKGKVVRDLLVADYTFSSEGTRSVRQVAFKWQDSVFVEGTGQSDMRNDTMLFKNIDSLKFGNTIRLRRVECE
jgi:hypothetical protein